MSDEISPAATALLLTYADTMPAVSSIKLPDTLSFIAVAPPPPGWTLEPGRKHPTSAIGPTFPEHLTTPSHLFTIFLEGTQEYCVLLHRRTCVCTSRTQVTSPRWQQKEPKKAEKL